MLIDFKVANFRSFGNEQLFSLVSSRDSSHPGNLIPCDGFSVAKVSAIYGSNASGKSNLIKAISALQRLVLTSATTMNLGDEIDVAPFRLNAETRMEPSRFEVTVLIDGTTYHYGFSATTARVHDEWLNVRRSGGRISQWMERTFDPAGTHTNWTLKGPIKKEAELLQSKTRDNGLALSRGAELNIDHLAPLFLWCRNTLRVLDLSSKPNVQSTAHRLARNDALRTRILDLVRDADFGITSLQVAEVPFSTALPANAPADLRELVSGFVGPMKMIAGVSDLTKFSVSTEHSEYPSGNRVQFNLEEDESNGTQRFFALAGPIIDALDNGLVLVIDELDCSMHPNLTRKIIELFNSSELNAKGAQLIFVTHDSSLMDASLFRRDQIWLTEKRQDGSTDLFSLYDIDPKKRPRNVESLERNYLSGRYGGVPKFGPVLEDLDVR